MEAFGLRLPNGGMAWIWENLGGIRIGSEQATALRPGISEPQTKKAMFAQQTITGRRTAAWNEPSIRKGENDWVTLMKVSYNKTVAKLLNFIRPVCFVISG